MTLRFGTDGVRGDADADLTPTLVAALGRAAARVFGTDRPFVVGRDTRESGPRLAADLTAGLRAEGADVIDAGVVSTPVVAFLAADLDARAAMVSASHNPFTDNGIKLFERGGKKLADDAEAAVEHELAALASRARPPDGAPGRAVPDGALDRYVDHVVDTIDGRRLDGLPVVLDTANGAATALAPRAFARLGADVHVIHAAPDGRNINAACGSTHPDDLRREVTSRGAVLGLAFDGDADRVIAVDERGDLVDGDRILAIVALDLHARGALRADTVAVTVMSNLGLRRALDAAGITVIETPVGDRAVLAAMEARGLALGGEQSGHIIFGDRATTGDGLLTGVVLADAVVRAGRPLSELAAVVESVPQRLENVRVGGPVDLDHPTIAAAIAAVAAQLGERGRVLVRPSGTEPLVRIMVEAPTDDELEATLAVLRTAVHEVAG
ncbi:MAG TPA: phosphoglucosamine mutase [Acidimicrobiia bacterium]|nr:phosphoglucosamine mutase [Acidimicrobiia bacterium]